MSIQSEIEAVRKRHPSWSFEQSWNHVMALKPGLETSSAESNRIAAKAAPQKEKEALARGIEFVGCFHRENFEHVETIAKRLMARDSRLTFGVALERVKLCLPAVQREIADLLRQPVKAEEPTKGRVL